MHLKNEESGVDGNQIAAILNLMKNYQQENPTQICHDTQKNLEHDVSKF